MANGFEQFADRFAAHHDLLMPINIDAQGRRYMD